MIQLQAVVAQTEVRVRCRVADGRRDKLRWRRANDVRKTMLRVAHPWPWIDPEVLPNPGEEVLQLAGDRKAAKAQHPVDPEGFGGRFVG